MRHCFFALLSLVLLAFTVSAQAQNALVGFSTTEKVGFAYYRLINRDPPVEDWVRTREDYKAAKPNVQLDIMRNERLRLREGYAVYFPDRDLLTMTVPMVFDAMDNPNYPSNIEAKAKELTKRVRIRFPQVHGQPYFPFQLGLLWVGLIPENLEDLFVRDMTEDEFQLFCRAVNDCANFSNRTLDTVLVLKPTAADAKEPLMDGDLPIWLLLAEVGALYVQLNGHPIEWKYTAPWYDEHQAQSLMTLFSK